jgi:hypothetical protein
MTNLNYENGYLPKIAYHIACRNYDKVEYFANRQREIDGEILPQHLVTIMEEVRKIESKWENEGSEVVKYYKNTFRPF